MGLAFIVGVLLFGFVIGMAARFAVPGPDPMPIWLTTGIGVLGSVAGGLLAQLFTDSAGSLLFAFGGAVGLDRLPPVGSGSRHHGSAGEESTHSRLGSGPPKAGESAPPHAG